MVVVGELVHFFWVILNEQLGDSLGLVTEHKEKRKKAKGHIGQYDPLPVSVPKTSYG